MGEYDGLRALPQFGVIWGHTQGLRFENNNHSYDLYDFDVFYTSPRKYETPIGWRLLRKGYFVDAWKELTSKLKLTLFGGISVQLKIPKA